jgi:hypothetical protein
LTALVARKRPVRPRPDGWNGTVPAAAAAAIAALIIIGVWPRIAEYH